VFSLRIRGAWAEAHLAHGAARWCFARLSWCIIRPGGAAPGLGHLSETTPSVDLMYTRQRFLAWRYLAQFPQGRKAARVSELFRVREGPFSFLGSLPLGALP